MRQAQGGVESWRLQRDERTWSPSSPGPPRYFFHSPSSANSCRNCSERYQRMNLRSPTSMVVWGWYPSISWAWLTSA
eukprot:scaffold22677_cov48-Phaeocystis_antarctica.AAC.2